MTRQRLVWILAAGSLLFTMAACKGGPSDPASYRSALKGMTPALTKLEMRTRDASTAGDPMQLSSALEKTVTAAKALASTVKKVEVGESRLAFVHGELLAAVQDHHSTLVEAASGAKATPIPVTKGLMNDSTDDLNAAIDAWNDALDAM
jgi:hypothetical protein